ncbi:MAG: hypothetical protein R3F11_00130 [Verrucomicrobiales bacterium]
METRSPWRAAIDFVLIAALIAGANALLDRSDPGWVALNPTPFLLAPILVGLRYGFSAGFISGVASVAGVMAARAALLGEGPDAMFQAHRIYVLALPIFGGLTGHLAGIIRANLTNAVVARDQLRAANAALRADLAAGRESQQQLQSELALSGIALASLDDDLRRLFGKGAGDPLPGALDLLAARCGIQGAALFLRWESGVWERRHALGSGSDLPADLRAGDLEILDRAGEARETVALPDLGAEASGEVIAAIPWREPGGAVIAMLLVTDLDFFSANWETLARAEIIGQWVAARLTNGGGVIDEADFRPLVAFAVQSAKRHRLPSTVLRVEAPHANGELTEAVVRDLHATASAARIDAAHNRYAILLPLEGKRDAERLAAALEQRLQAGSLAPKTIPINRDASEAAVWKELED